MAPLKGTTLQGVLQANLTKAIKTLSNLPAADQPSLEATRTLVAAELAKEITLAIVTYLNTLQIQPGSIKTVGGPAAQTNLIVPPSTFFLESN